MLWLAWSWSRPRARWESSHWALGLTVLQPPRTGYCPQQSEGTSKWAPLQTPQQSPQHLYFSPMVPRARSQLVEPDL